MSRTNIRSVIAVLLVSLLAFLGSCKKEEPNTGCGNGLLGIEEACDCGTDPENLPVGCTAINGAVGGTCTEDCRHTAQEICGNEIDDDGDGDVDCDDSDCSQYPPCLPEICNNDIDDNANGKKDCEDEECADLTICITEVCTGGVDENQDGRVDCQDAQCIGAPECAGVEVCWNNYDDNADGFTDCDDPACFGPEFEQFCEPEDCENGVDDNDNFKVDCADSDCIEVGPCAQTACGAEDVDDTVTLSIPAGTQVVRRTVDVAASTNDLSGQCDVTGGKEFVLAINVVPEPGERGRLRIAFHQAGDHKFGLYFKGGPDAGCADTLGSTCVNQAPNTSGVLEYGSLPASKYFLIIAEGSLGAGGQVDLVLTLADPNNPVELCNNELDDDANGQVDCGDLACFERTGVCDFTGCDPSQRPVPEFEAGSLDGNLVPMSPMPDPVADPFFALDTRGQPADFQVSCLPFGGGDQLVRFELTEVSFIQVGFKQGMASAGDHALGLFFAGNGCELAEHSCLYTAGSLNGLLEFPGDPALGGMYPPGEYYLVVKSTSGNEGRINIQIMALDSRRELCDDDGYDNDGNGFANCDEPGQPGACDGHHLCIAEDCSSPTADLDGDGYAGCSDTDPDDQCTCSLPCACTQPCIPTEHVCDWRYDPGVTNLGTFHLGDPSVLVTVDTSSATAEETYVLDTCHGDINYVQPDHVFWFELAFQADVVFTFNQPTGADHVGQLLRADRCRACDERGSSGQYHIYCYATPSSWLQSLDPGAYVLIIKPKVDVNGTVLSGPFELEFTAGP
ncbi:MAG: hypothetical protein ABI333_17670 [bacterium]